MVKEIPLTKGYVALVDDEDYDYLMQWKWRALVGPYTVYAVRQYRDKSTGKRVGVYMHRLIMNAPKGLDVDHRNWDGLNNQRENLRLATRSQNIAWSRRLSEPSLVHPVYRGVYPRGDRWDAQIGVGGKTRHLGVFDDPEIAAKAYDTVAAEIHGEFAMLNFPDQEAA